MAQRVGRWSWMVVALVGAACITPGDAQTADDRPAANEAPTDQTAAEPYAFPAAPQVPDGSPPPLVDDAVARLVSSLFDAGLDVEALDVVAGSGDPRYAWYISDLLRFVAHRQHREALAAAFAALTGVDASADPAFADSDWKSITDHLIAWDLEAPPRYRTFKAQIYLAVDERWEPFFLDRHSDIDWRLVSWGGVFIDDRVTGDGSRCDRGCIPALDDPALTDAAGGSWYDDDGIVFAVEVEDEPVAFPKHIMEVHEMVNLTIGGRRVGIPYCTLCGSAQAYFTDSVPADGDTVVLRTSGLLSRSNKLMYDLNTRSAIDTFTGRALSGPLRRADVTLEQTTVVTTTWRDWKATHPQTRIVAEDGGIGRRYDLDPLQGRDDHGPIFPIGDADPRLPVQTQVLGVVTADGTPVAFPVEQARDALAAGDAVRVGDVEVVEEAGGLVAHDRRSGDELVTHQAFWFAWSQFMPDTQLWTPIGT